MRTSVSRKAFFLLALAAPAAIARADAIVENNSTITVASTNTNVAATAIGQRSLADVGGVVVVGDSRLSNATITNNSFNTNGASTSIGNESIAGLGSVIIRDARVTNSRITVSSINRNAAATAIGTASIASVGSVIVGR